MLTDHGKVQEVNSAGDPVSEAKNEEHPTDPVKEMPKISLQEVYCSCLDKPRSLCFQANKFKLETEDNSVRHLNRGRDPIIQILS